MKKEANGAAVGQQGYFPNVILKLKEFIARMKPFLIKISYQMIQQYQYASIKAFDQHRFHAK